MSPSFLLRLIPLKSLHVTKSGCCLLHGRQPSPSALCFLHNVHTHIPPTLSLDIPFSEIPWVLYHIFLLVFHFFPLSLCNSLDIREYFLYSSLPHPTHTLPPSTSADLQSLEHNWCSVNPCLFSELKSMTP